MSRKNPAIRTVTIGLAVLLIIAKLFGFLREIIIAKYFGTGSEYDIYLIGISIPVAIFGLFSYAFANIFIPTYSYAISSGDRKSGIRILWSDFNLSVVTAIILAVMMISVAPQIIRLIAPGLNAAAVEGAAHILRISAVIIAIAVFESFFRSVLNAEKMFFVPAMAPIAANVVIIGSILLFAGVAGTGAILYGLVVGYTLQMVIVFMPFARTGVLRLAHMGFFRHHSEKFFEAAVLIIIVAASIQLFGIIDRFFGSMMPPGVVSALGYSALLVLMSVDVFAYAVSTAIFPYLTDAFSIGDLSRAGQLLTRGIMVSLLIAAPLMIILWFFPKELVTLLFQRGEFDEHSVVLTSRLLKFFSVGLAGQFLLMLLSRAYYAARNFRFLALVLVTVVIFKGLAAKYLAAALGYTGLAISGSAAYTLGAVALVLAAHRTVAPIDWGRLVSYLIKLLIAAALSAGLGWWLMRHMPAYGGDPVELIISLIWRIAAVFAVYIGAAAVLRVEDLHFLTAMFGAKKKNDVDKN